MRIVFFGTPQFAKTILEYLLEQGGDIVAVVTRPDRPKGRSNKPIPSPVKEFALEKKLPVYQPPKASAPEFATFLKGLDADFFVVAAYAEILKENVLEIPKFGCINVHGSILPKYRGAAPIQRAIMAGEEETGVTIMKMALEMDAGDILAIQKTPIPENMTAGELTEKLAEIGKAALWGSLCEVQKGEAKPTKQNPEEASYAKKLRSEDGEIKWAKPCHEVYNHIRGVTPKPGAWCWVEMKGEKKRLLIKKALLQPSHSGEPGEILSKKEFIVGCASGAVQLLEVQLEGKKTVEGNAFLRGASNVNLKL